MLNRVAIPALVCLGLSLSAVAESTWVTSEEYPNFQVVLSDDVPEPEYLSASRFVVHWKQMTGYDIPVSRYPDPDKVNVWIGEKDNPFISARDLEGLGTDGYLIRSISGRRSGRGPRQNAKPAGKHLIIVGGTPRGTLYAEWDFFENVVGVRAYTQEAVVWPETPKTLPKVDIRYVPPIEYRDISYRLFVAGGPINNASHLNGHWSMMPARWGGRTAFVRGAEGFGHTFHYFVDPEEYYDEHPEYFAEIGGLRVKYAQLCLTNADVLEITIEKVRDSLRNAAEDERIVSVSQMDYFWFDSWCTCVNCRAIDEREGSHSGTIIHFVNQIADAISDEFPDAYIDTFAYTYSRKPPKHLKVRENVIVRLCDVECDFSRPLSDRRSPRNRAFVRDLKKWRRITENLHIWDYTQNWYSFQGPHPNIHVLQSNIELFAKHGVKGVYEQASPFSPHSDFEVLKGYILAKSLWDPHIDWREVYWDFLNGYYKEAAPFIDEYLRLITERVQRDEVVLTFANTMAWIDYELVERAQEIFERAFASVESEELLQRLKFAYIPVQYAALVCPPRVYRGEDAYIFTRPPSQTFDEYWAMLEEYGVTHLNDYRIEKFRERLDAKTPPRYETVPIEKVRNEQLELWVLPTQGGAVVRLLDRVTGRDLLSGHNDILSVRGKFQEWVVLEGAEWSKSRPVGEPYAVVERGETYIVLQTQLRNGIEIRREIRLLPDTKAVDIVLHLRNRGETPIWPMVELYPEFSTAQLGKPQIWIERGGVWTRSALEKRRSARNYIGEFSAEGVSRWAYRFPQAQISIVNTIDSVGVGFLSYVYAPEAAYISMGQSLAAAMLAPGEARSVRTRFEITSAKPKAL